MITIRQIVFACIIMCPMHVEAMYKISTKALFNGSMNPESHAPQHSSQTTHRLSAQQPSMPRIIAISVAALVGSKVLPYIRKMRVK